MCVGDSSVSTILPKLYLNDAFKCQRCIYMLSQCQTVEYVLMFVFGYYVSIIWKKWCTTKYLYIFGN